jgi:hypothetical protein
VFGIEVRGLFHQILKDTLKVKEYTLTRFNTLTLPNEVLVLIDLVVKSLTPKCRSFLYLR